MRVNIKPLSCNDAWKGKRFKSTAYKKYELDLLFLLPKFQLPEPPYEIYLKFYFSSAASDLDNPVKQILDIFQKKYGINDKHVYKLVVEKGKAEKGQEWFEFLILPYEPIVSPK